MPESNDPNLEALSQLSQGVLTVMRPNREK
jgi:hypothetical protein